MALVIRKARKGDAEAVIKFWNENFDSGHMKYTGSNWHRGKSDLKQFSERYRSDKRGEFTFVAIDPISNKLVGVCGARSKERGRMRHKADLGWWADREYGGRGIATKLVNRSLKEAKLRGFKKVQAEAAAVNVASIKVAKKCGFKIEGRLKAGIILDSGRYADTYIFGKVLR